jgi:hypothetical protein
MLFICISDRWSKVCFLGEGEFNMRKLVLTSLVAGATLIVGAARAGAQTVFDIPGEVVGGGVSADMDVVYVAPYGRRHYVATYAPYNYAPYGFDPYAYGAPPGVQCGFGFGCRYWPSNQPYDPYRW